MISIPADSATFRLHDALLTRLSNDGEAFRSWTRSDSADSMEKSLSTFAAEMATSAMVLGKRMSR